MKFSCNNIYKKYYNNMVLKNFSYTFEPGLYLVLGNNGVGKSTLLKTLCKVIESSNPNCKIDKIKTAFLCEKIELLNCKVYPFLKSISKINNAKYDITKEMLIWNLPNKNIYNLSKGNKQKIGIIMMMLSDVDMYILDEPTNALDGLSIEILKHYIKRLLENKKIVIIATHSINIFSDFVYKEIRLG